MVLGHLSATGQTRPFERSSLNVFHFNATTFDTTKFELKTINAVHLNATKHDYAEVLTKIMNGKLYVPFNYSSMTFGKHSAVSLRFATQHVRLFEQFDLSDVVKFENVVFVINEENILSTMTTLFVIFKKEVWIMIAAAIFITSAALWILSTLHPKNKNRNEFQQTLLDVFLATLWGSFSSISKKKEARYIIICYLVYHIHIQTGFSCNLTTILTTPRFEPGITNIEQLADTNIPLYAPLIFKSYYFVNNTNPDKSYIKIKDRMEYITDWNTNSNILLLKNRSAIMMNELQTKELLYSINNTIRIIKIPAHSITGSVRFILHLSYGDFFTETLNNFIKRMTESGIIQSELKNIYEKSTLRDSENNLIPLSLNHLLCAFVFLVIGLVIAGIVFAVEVGYRKR
ncbi:hypothetical protein FQR65_LT09820 [Abscondita terminalis]|nr:hypothetical protein FQR65_LT09820 [Abscondita terminalis]